VESGPDFANTVDSDVGTLADPGRYEGGSAGGAVSRLNGTNTEMIGISIFDSNLLPRDQLIIWIRSHYHGLLYNGLIDLSGLCALQAQDDTAGAFSKDLACLLFPLAEISSCSHNMSIHDIIGMDGTWTWR
jgi:hypothetical protein